MFSTIAIISFIFLLLYLVVIGSNNQNLENPLVALSQTFFGGYSNIIVALIGCAASLGSLMTTLSTISRNVFSMSEKGFLPKNLYQVSRNNTPVNAIVRYGGGEEPESEIVPPQFVFSVPETNSRSLSGEVGNVSDKVTFV